MNNQRESNLSLLDSGREAAALFKDDGLPLRLMQKSLTSYQRYLLRTDPEILYSLFALNPPDLLPGEDNYYFWDSTTLSLFDIAQSFFDRYLEVKPDASLLDLGCGPYATLGCALKKLYPYLHVIASDVDPGRTKNAKNFSMLNRVNISTICSDLFDCCPDQYDLILFNPPYMQPGSQQHHSLRLSVKEIESGISRDTTPELISRLLSQFLVLPGDPTLLIGINNYFLPHHSIMEMLRSHHLNISTLYSESAVTPVGAFCQVYSVKKSC